MKFLSNFFKGIAISISQIVPGVSGGTIAIILGIYDDLIHAINNILNDFKNQYKLLVQVGLGAIIGIFLFSNIVKNIITKYPIEAGFFFIGIILGGAPLMYKKATKKGLLKKNLVYLGLGILIVVIMSGEYIDNSNVITNLNILNFIWLFIGGIIVAIALILPGISGSFMLLILGLYNTVLTAVSDLNFLILAPIGLGVIIGTIATARTIERLLNKYPQQIYMLIFGFVLGSVVSIFPGIPTGISSIVSVILLVLGFIFIYKISEE
ncbi:DUF368 domain-containing protein [Clostridium senegalense]|uniref:DUF368 domain-containing protein n=1 Tax=Clostridium senegalense TaxID=1465809 RepID=UPI001C111F71|nr:DUF368 domain-containing protein [Clostridium senegalense]MBU5227301.1 DUF368 domain-containing protein [Clostridium senegalense]